ncbi:MAG: hypothetical protein HN392_07835 [Anaerolineae bacterium]|jgi:hypothetical protein|nr:hypothetical protein [Anaerolineae bacterium]MBT7783339.1 hypothetical protein [Anaerolineae bacterium]
MFDKDLKKINKKNISLSPCLLITMMKDAPKTNGSRLSKLNLLGIIALRLE